MRDGEKQRRSYDAYENRAGSEMHSEDSLDETTINEFLAERDREDQGNKNGALKIVLWKDAACQLGQNAPFLRGVLGKFSDAKELICRDEPGEDR